MGRIRPNKILYRSTKATHLIEVLQELYICDRQRNHHQQKSGCEQLQRPGTQTVTYVVLEHFAAELRRLIHWA